MSEAKVRVRVAHNAMHLPVVALRGLVVFPNNVVHFEVRWAARSPLPPSRLPCMPTAIFF